MKTKRLTINRTSWIEFRDTMREHIPFTTGGNLRGEPCSFVGLGRLPEPYRSELAERANGGHVDYAVYSYATPIAWHDRERGWIFPEARYSVTTSKAQGRIAPAVEALNAERVADALGVSDAPGFVDASYLHLWVARHEPTGIERGGFTSCASAEAWVEAREDGDEYLVYQA